MKTTKLKSLQNEIAKLERELENARREQLRNLHTEYGFGDRSSLIKALQELGDTSARPARAGRKAPTAKSAGPAKSGKKRPTRATITPEMKARVKELAQAGELTSAQIAKEVGISLPSVQNIKKEFGLVRGRK